MNVNPIFSLLLAIFFSPPVAEEWLLSCLIPHYVLYVHHLVNHMLCSVYCEYFCLSCEFLLVGLLGKPKSRALASRNFRLKSLMFGLPCSNGIENECVFWNVAVSKWLYSLNAMAVGWTTMNAGIHRGAPSFLRSHQESSVVVRDQWPLFIFYDSVLAFIHLCGWAYVEF